MTSTTSYTPGPWQVIEHSGSVYSDLPYPTVVPPVCHGQDDLEGWRPPTRYYLEPTPINLSETPEQCDARHRRAREHQLADARLMAAAPELLECCASARHLLDDLMVRVDDAVEKESLHVVCSRINNAMDKALSGEMLIAG
jgi:hypothetical protein